jgi:hypothetical protein
LTDINRPHAGLHPVSDASGVASRRGRASMMDMLMVIAALGFFALSLGYAYACDRL